MAWSKNNTKKLFPEQKHIISPAFEVGGVTYYQFDDIFHLPFERGLMALSVYEETRMKCTYEYLQQHVEATRKLLTENKKGINIFKINELNEQLSQRLQFSFDTELLYKLASVVYFDENENPSLYEMDYCQKKIKHWKEHNTASDFFFATASTRIDTLLKECQYQFRYVFGSDGGDKQSTFGTFAIDHLNRFIEGFEEWKEVLKSNGVEIVHLTLFEYFSKLDKLLIKNGRKKHLT